MGHTVRMEDLADGGLVNDRSGKHTRKMRETIRGKTVDNPPSAYERSRPVPMPEPKFLKRDRKPVPMPSPRFMRGKSKPVPMPSPDLERFHR